MNLRTAAWCGSSVARSTTGRSSCIAWTQWTSRAGTTATFLRDGKIARQIQYQEYILNEVLPLVRHKNGEPAAEQPRLQLWRLPRREYCPPSPGRFYRLSLHVGRVRHHELPARLLRSGRLLQYAAALSGEHERPWYIERYRRNTYVLATGWDDQCLGARTSASPTCWAAVSGTSSQSGTLGTATTGPPGSA